MARFLSGDPPCHDGDSHDGHNREDDIKLCIGRPVPDIEAFPWHQPGRVADLVLALGVFATDKKARRESTAYDCP